MNQGHFLKALGLPADRAIDGVVQLKIAAAMAELVQAGGGAVREIGGLIAQKPVVELAGRDGTDDMGRREFAAVGKPDACCLAVLHQDPVDIGAGAQLTAVLLDQTPEGIDRLTGAAPDHGSAGCFQREGDDLAHLAAIGGPGRQSGVQRPGAQSAWTRSEV